MTPHETPTPGHAADFAADLCARLPALETARTRLRAPRLTDFDAWAEVLCGPATEFLDGPFTRDEAFVEFTASVGGWLLRGHGPWTVEDKAGGAVLGFVLLGFEPGDLDPELGFLFLPAAEGRGLAFEAASAARDHALRLNLPSLVSYVAAENHRSARLAARLGARAEPAADGASVIWRHWPQGGLQ